MSGRGCRVGTAHHAIVVVNNHGSFLASMNVAIGKHHRSARIIRLGPDPRDGWETAVRTLEFTADSRVRQRRDSWGGIAVPRAV
jgi:hypothetical protein